MENEVYLGLYLSGIVGLAEKRKEATVTPTASLQSAGHNSESVFETGAHTQCRYSVETLIRHRQLFTRARGSQLVIAQHGNLFPLFLSLTVLIAVNSTEPTCVTIPSLLFFTDHH